MTSAVDDLVLDFYERLFTNIFFAPFQAKISDRRKRKKVSRQIEEAADAASKSLTRFFEYQKLDEDRATTILDCFEEIANLVTIEDAANSNIPTEEIVDDLLTHLPCPEQLQLTHAATYRLALHTIIQVLMQVAQVMAEWQKLNFAETFELIRSVVNKLNEISRQVEAQGKFGQDNADRDYELLHRDYILQRFHKVEAGTVRMTTNLDVDLRELFVMPKVRVRKSRLDIEDAIAFESNTSLMNLDAARQRFGTTPHYADRVVINAEGDTEKSEENCISAFEQVTNSKYPFNVLVGLPGAGKSTFLEWLQVKIAAVEEVYELNGEQAIPLLLKVRQLDPLNLSQGSTLIEKATASKDRAIVMPSNWLNRQMTAGRVLFMLDGLDEIEPELRDKHLIPWLLQLQESYPKCDYLISSRPVGYPFGMLKKYKFIESELVDFNPEQIQTYTRNWCTAVRLARNELDTEARREGAIDGDKIAQDIQQSPYIRDLARNPLMLSAIYLVYYFESGKLPDDRAILYKLCVEGLLHHWDSRRGIHSEFSFSEKLRACREVALAMQADDSAEYESEKVLAIFTDVLQDAERASQLLEHIRYRTGLLLERRPDIFGFAHLTFQEYLAATAIHEGNKLGITPQQLVVEHDDSRWREVIALYAGEATTPAVRELIEGLIAQKDTVSLGEVLADVYFAAKEDLKQDVKLRKRVIERIAIAPFSLKNWNVKVLEKFSKENLTKIVNHSIGRINSNISISYAFNYLIKNKNIVKFELLENKIKLWMNLNSEQLDELVYIIHLTAPSDVLLRISKMNKIYESDGANFSNFPYEKINIQAESALMAIASRFRKKTIFNITSTDIELLDILEYIIATIFISIEAKIDRINCFSKLFISKVNKLIEFLETVSWQPLNDNKQLILSSLYEIEIKLKSSLNNRKILDSNFCSINDSIEFIYRFTSLIKLNE
ncbi:MAG: NACHT domain-containing protein [Cyanobacteria bacterium P01_G01_bin.19]